MNRTEQADDNINRRVFVVTIVNVRVPLQQGTERRRPAETTHSASYSVGPRFKSLPEDWLSQLSWFAVYLSPSAQVQGQ
jgi:hypothetical protein